MEDPRKVLRRLGSGELLYINSLEITKLHTVTHVKRVVVGPHRWCILTLNGMHSELMVAKDAFTVNEEFFY